MYELNYYHCTKYVMFTSRAFKNISIYAVTVFKTNNLQYDINDKLFVYFKDFLWNRKRSDLYFTEYYHVREYIIKL